MITGRLTDAIARQEWLETAEEGVQKTLHRTFEALPNGRRIKNALNGTWIGHPLHVILTDIPLGCWTAAMVFDLLEAWTGRRQWRTAADASIAFGLAGAVGAAVTGAADWQDIDPPARRIGLVHGMMNTLGAGLFTASLLMRRRNARAAGRVFSALGTAVAMTSARLGGHLVYSERIGVDHSVDRRLPEDFTAVLAENEIAEGRMRRVEWHGTPILLARQSGRVFALAETCSHLGGPLSEGALGPNSVQCPWHGSCFALDDGRVLGGPAVHPQPCLEVRTRDGRIEVRRATASRSMEAAEEVQPVPDRP
jgi:nitrite reductase/ring-hydroxylating ferredoxin subunit/uncharacterized membrane protein